VGWKEKAMEAAKAAETAARGAASAASDKGDELMLKRKVNALAEELGHVTYRQHEGLTGLDDEVNRIVGEMRALHVEIAAIKGPES
jgi:hypothetical protein